MSLVVVLLLMMLLMLLLRLLMLLLVWNWLHHLLWYMLLSRLFLLLFLATRLSHCFLEDVAYDLRIIVDVHCYRFLLTCVPTER